MEEVPAGPALTDLAAQLIADGFDFTSCDLVDSNADLDGALLLIDIGAPPRSALHRLPATCIPAVCFCLESPLIVHRVFHNLQDAVRPYRHTFIWPGAEELLQGAETTFHPLFWPNERREIRTEVPWEARDRICMVNTNKRGHVLSLRQIDPRNLGATAREAAAAMMAKIYRRTDPWMRSDLYVERLHAIAYFGQGSDFHLYGAGWTRPPAGTRGRFDSAIARSYRGPVSYRDKDSVLERYRYVICYENTIFPGYITDKIFDCFFAGAIPIYLGAPDIEQFVPRETFIDKRDFDDYSELATFLDELTSPQAHGYLEAAREFLGSSHFEKFTSDDFVRRVSDAIKDVHDTEN